MVSLDRTEPRGCLLFTMCAEQVILHGLQVPLAPFSQATLLKPRIGVIHTCVDAFKLPPFTTLDTRSECSPSSQDNSTELFLRHFLDPDKSPD